MTETTKEERDNLRANCVWFSPEERGMPASEAIGGTIDDLLRFIADADRCAELEEEVLRLKAERAKE